jgi:RHH-type proline utilization regulon transcriptional repressor/proline dehydrogenase/delta 1-pyrroline-5-carboxylate dehydrogenase
VPLIAETGGINAMIVDATALPEQVIDDVIASAFRSAGQRCSALRLLCLQDDVAERMLDMLIGATRELKVGDPREPRDPCRPGDRRRGESKSSKAGSPANQRAGRVRFAGTGRRACRPAGTYVAPAVIELDRAAI